ncbi:MAG TPA: ABC transporter permease [Thermoanaerobaculia bacterium]|nr:ABC transporter permease [Thermoanaerobaculia bacterium]
MTQPVEMTLRPAAGGGWLRHGFLLRSLVARDFRGRYAGSLLGLLWSFVHPLWLLALYTFVFATVLKVSLLGERTETFGVFLFAGLLPWTAVHEGVLRGATAITDNAPLVKKVRFPSAVLVLTVVVAALLHQAIALGVFLVVLALLGEPSGAGLPLLLVAVPLQVALTLGLALGLSAVNVFFRDVPQVLGLALNAWFFLTPIVYPLHLVPEWFRPWLELNPLTALVDLYRQALLGDALALPGGTGALAVTSLVILCAGLWTFRRLRPQLVDEI